MASRLIFSPLVLAAALLSVTPALAAVPGAGKPGITIISPQNGATIHGGTVTLHVAVSNFKLVPPVYINPPLLPGNQGHIHYVLDALANFVATRDARVALSHTWTGVSPGPHTLIAYLATSQHNRFPGTNQVSVHVTVAGASAGGATTPTAPRPAPTEVTASRLATTGGGAPGSRSRVELPAAVAGIMCLLVGMSLLAWRRLNPQPEGPNF